MVVNRRSRERHAHRFAHVNHWRLDRLAGALSDPEGASRVALTRFVDRERTGRVLGEQETLMGAAAGYDTSAGVEDQRLVDHVLAVALHVTVDDDRSRVQPLAHHHRREEVEFLARMQVAVEVGQVPVKRMEDRRMNDERGRDRAAERRGSAIPWIVVAGARDVAFDQVRRDFVFGAAEVAADIDLISVKDGRWFNPAHVLPALMPV